MLAVVMDRRAIALTAAVFAFAATGCDAKSPPPDSGAPISSPSAGKRLVDEIELQAVCALAQIPTPPAAWGTALYRTGLLQSADRKTRYPWVIVDGEAPQTAERDAETYLMHVESALSNQHESMGTCGPVWRDLLPITIVTAIVRFAGREDGAGDYAALAFARQKFARKKLIQVTHDDARKQVVELARELFGSRVIFQHAETSWANAAAE
jgi:hypothetical protein